MVEDETLKRKGYIKVEHMFFPTLDFSRLRDDAVKQFNGHPQVFKPIASPTPRTRQLRPACGGILAPDTNRPAL
jgi:hypothetical protein